MRSTARVARLLVALAIGLGPVACSVAPVPSLKPLPATARPPSPGASGSLAPAPTATSTPAPPVGGLAEWRQLPPQDGLRDARFVSVAPDGDGFLGLGCVTLTNEGCIRPAIWESGDGLEWRTTGPVFIAPGFSSGTVFAAASSRIGTVAAGNLAQGDRRQASIWLRGADGWVQFTPQSASDATVNALLATDGRVIAVGSGLFLDGGSGFRAWWSADGTTWQAAPSLPDQFGGYPTAMLPVAGALLAWGFSCGGVCPVLPSGWWLSVDGTAWRAVDPPDGLEGANVMAIGRTEGGFEAFGSIGAPEPLQPAAWAADETATVWRRVEPLAQPEATTVGHHLLVGHGSVAAGTGPPGPGREQQTGLVWLRGPGDSAWRAPVEIPDVEIVALLQSPQQLNRIIVIGRTFEGLQEHLVIWTGLVDWAA